MASKRVETGVTAGVVVALAALAIAKIADPPQTQPAISRDAAFEQRFQKAEREKREQERALFCAGRPENC